MAGIDPNGRVASDPGTSPADALMAKYRLAIEGVEPFKVMYAEYRENEFPQREVMRDCLSAANVGVGDLAECVDLFIVNAKHLGVLQTSSGSEILMPIETVLAERPKDAGMPHRTFSGTSVQKGPTNDKLPSLEKICFYVAPIGVADSEVRKHSDLFLNSIIEPALHGFGLTVVRADQIGETGMITAQILEHLLKARLVIADLSFQNPNVFYELAIRHAAKLPIVRIIRKADAIPFDVSDVRTIVIDTTDIYTLVPQLETFRSEVATHVRQALVVGGQVSNPLTAFCPSFKITMS